MTKQELIKKWEEELNGLKELKKFLKDSARDEIWFEDKKKEISEFIKDLKELDEKKIDTQVHDVDDYYKESEEE